MIITEKSNDLTPIKPVKEIMGTTIKGINQNIPFKNGAVVCICGPPGSGKTALMLSLFRDKNYYKKKFNHIYLITPEASYISVSNHPFKNHDKVYHDLTEDLLENIYQECVDLKNECIENDFEIEYSCLIIDDFASDLKRNDLILALKRFLTKTRHIFCVVVMTIQAYNMLPLVIRKLINNLILFKPRNKIEIESVRKELINMNETDTNLLLNYVYDEPYNHLDIDTNTDEKRKNFRLLSIS
mgnify:CR=1 FL=1